MIISASYKTDIPAFYGEWFMRRLRAGYCLTVNPYGRQIYRVPLTPDQADGFIFWTRNIGPFLPHLPTVRSMGLPFVVQYTVTGYPRSLDAAVPDPARSVQHMQQLADRYGPGVAVWRYDPVIFTSLTPPDFHRRNFANLARMLEGSTDEVIISFAQIYRKSRRNLERSARQEGFTWEDPPGETKRDLAADLASIAGSHSMRLTICSQADYLAGAAREARCVDTDRLSLLTDRPVTAPEKGNRPDCRCHQSRDIGEYDTCPHGCVYCYAVERRLLAQARHRAHNPEGEFLFPPDLTICTHGESLPDH